MNRDFKGIWIPKEIWLHQDLSIQEKCLLVEIDSLDNSDKGCFASNEYLGEFIGLSAKRIANMLTRLRKINLVKTVSYDGRNRSLKITVPKYGKSDIPKMGSQTSRKKESTLPETGNILNTVNNTDNNITPKIPTNKNLPGVIKKEKDYNEFSIEVKLIMKRTFVLFDVEIRNRVKDSKKQMTDWLYVIEMLNRKDGYSFEEIEKVILWGREDVFWRKNFMSIARLRDNDGGVLKFEKIKAAMAGDNKQQNGQKSNKESKGNRVIEAEQNFVTRLEKASRNAMQE